MKILVTGFKGQLGYDIVKEAKNRGIEACGVDIEDMDITDQESVEKVITSGNYDAVVHCAAYTAVDRAEEENEVCYLVNVLGTKYIANVCKKLDIPMMYFSTDYVFNGEGENYFEVDDQKQPLSVYGQTKYEGELAVLELAKHFIIRISWVFGINGHNFIKTMLKLSETRNELNVVCDQIGSPTYTFDLAKLVLDMIVSDKYGTYHATNEGICSWHEFACEIFKQAGIEMKVNAITSDQYPQKAKRPKNSRMSKEALKNAGFDLLPTWQDALSRYLIELNVKKSCQ